MVPVLALDLGSTTGYAIRQASGEVISGVLSLGGPPNPQLKGTYDERVMMLLETLRMVIEEYKIEVIAFEDVQFHVRGTAQLKLWSSLRATVWIAGAEAPGDEMKFISMPVSTLKKAATGNGRAKKPEMLEAAREFKPDITDHNEADALLLLLTVLDEYVDTERD